MTTDWRRFVFSYNGATAIRAFTIWGTTNTAATIIIDAVQIEQSLSASTYFDGDSTGYYSASQVASPLYSWTGKPHNSISTRDRNAANGGALVNLQNDLGLIITGVIGADNPAQNNQIVRYNQSDGAMLQDSLIPDRQVSFIGQISGVDKNDLMRKLALFSKYFARDTVANRQPKYFVFQHKADRQLVGQPMYFSGVVTNAMQVPVTNTLNVNISVTITMIDPFFYGHSESAQLQGASGTGWSSSAQYMPGSFIVSATTYLRNNLYYYSNQNLNAVYTAPAYSQDDLTALAVAPNGDIYAGYSTGYLFKYTAQGGASMVPIGGLNYVSANGAINALAFSPDGADLWIGGAFTVIDFGASITANRIVRYNIAGQSANTYGAGAGGGVNGTVTSIAIRGTRTISASYNYDVFIGGAFTATTGGVTVNRIARIDKTANAWLAFGTGSGMNAQVNALAYNDQQDRLYIGGAFTTSQGGVANVFTYICYINYSALATTVAFYTGFNNTVNCIYANPVNNSVWVGGTFTQLFSGVTMNLAAGFNGSTWSQLRAGLYGTSVTWITPFQNGLFLCGQVSAYDTSLSSNLGAAWYNYNSVFPVPFNAKTPASSGYFYRAVSRGDGVLFMGTTGLGKFSSDGLMPGAIVTATNTGSAAAAINWVFYDNDANFSDLRIIQARNQTDGTQISFTGLYPGYLDIVAVSSRYGTITSYQFGNLLRTMQTGSNLTTMSILPGANTLVLGYYTLSTTSPINSFVAYWTQTYNNLFDGVSAI